jgi:GAF domain-containing protein
MQAPLSVQASAEARRARHAEVRETIEALLEGEDDWVAAMATVVPSFTMRSNTFTGRVYRAVLGDL